jgi:hypothetical protein
MSCALSSHSIMTRGQPLERLTLADASRHKIPVAPERALAAWCCKLHLHSTHSVTANFGLNLPILTRLSKISA